MNDYCFGGGSGRVSSAEADRLDSIAQRHGAVFVQYDEPDGSWRYWFAGQNFGDPYNRMMERDVLSEVGKVVTVGSGA